MKYDTGISPAWLYPLDGNRYTVGFDPNHEGGDVWAADAAVATMKNEKKWSGVFVTLPGVDKAAHMWGSIDDPGGTVPMTHMRASAKVADEQVGKIVGHLRKTGQLDDTLVVLTSDHGSVPGRDFHGVDADGQGFYNWYYGTLENDEYLDPQPALQPLVEHPQRRDDLLRLDGAGLAEEPVPGEGPAGCRRHGEDAWRLRRVETAAPQPLRPRDAGALGPDAVRRVSARGSRPTPRSCSTPRPRSTAPT